MFEGVEERCVQAMREVYDLYRLSRNATRSTKLTKNLHGWIQSEIQNALGSEYEIISQSLKSSTEERIQGMYYKKNVDVCVKRNNHILGVISAKFVRSNYRQNALNYFEGQLGETANLRRNKIVFGHLMLLTDPIPYKLRSGEGERMERINSNDILKYKILVEDQSYAHAPDMQALCIAKLNYNRDDIIRICRREDLRQISEDAWNAIKGPLRLEKFFTDFVNAVRKKAQ